MTRRSNVGSNHWRAGGRLALRHANARLEILRAAARIFRVRGVAGIGMRQIAAAAGLSAANLYHYFRGKDEILFFCQDRSLDRLLDALATARASRGPLAERLRRLAVAHVLCLIDEVEGSTAHFLVHALPPRLRASIVAKRDRYERGVRALVADGIRRGLLRRADPTVGTRAFLGALNWTAHWFRPEGSQSADSVAEHVADYAVAGLLRSSGKGRFNEAPGARHTGRQRGANRGRVRALQDAARGPA